MKILTTRENLVYGVQTVQKAVSAKNPLPILSGILIKTEDNKVTFMATDLEMGIKCSIPVSVIEEGSVVLPARYMSEMVRRLPDTQIKMETDKENFSTVVNYGTSEFSLLGFSADQYPSLPDIESDLKFSIKQELFKNMIKQVSFATSPDDNRPIFTGVLVEKEGSEIHLVATDTHRLAFRKGTTEAEGGEQPVSVIIPAKTLNEVSRIMTGEENEIQITFGENQVVFETADVKIYSRLIAGQFPNYKQVIPQGCKTKIKVRTRDLLESVDRASLLAKEGTNVIRITVNQQEMIINSNSPDIGKIHEVIPVHTEGEETQIAFNSKYLSDVLKVIDTEEVLLELTGSLSPGIIKPLNEENYIYLILPVRIV